MGEILVAPSVPRDSNSLDLQTPNNSGFFNKIFKKKKKQKEIVKEQPNQAINEDPEIKEIIEEKAEHVLKKINNIDKDIQIGQNNKIKRYPALDSIEEVHFDSKTKDERINEDNINQLRKALGLIKDKSDKIDKIEKFREGLFNDSTKKQEIVTNLSLEEKLGVKLDQSPSEEVQHLIIGVTMDTCVPKVSMFRLSNGKQLYSLRDLKNSLENISDLIFSSHVFGKKNDFANWVKNVMNEPELAKLIRKCKTKETFLSLLVSLEKKEIKELIKLKKDEILEEHSESLKDLKFLGNEREELMKERTNLFEEKNIIDKLKKEFEKRIKEIESRETRFKVDIETAKLEKLSYEKREEALENAKKDYFNAIKNQTDELSKIRKELLNQTKKYKENLEEDYLGRKKGLENEFNARFITLEKSFEERRKQAKEDYELKQQRLNQRESDFRKEQGEINKLYHSKLEELKLEETKIFDFQSQFKEQELKLIKQESEISKHLTALNKTLIETKLKDEEVKRQVEFKKNLLFEIKQRELNLRKTENKLEKKTFRKYLNNELKSILNPEEKIVIKDQKNEEKIAKLYADINLCRKLLEKNNPKDARITYKQIREKFYSLELEQDEKDILFNVIKELYTEIHIKMI